MNKPVSLSFHTLGEYLYYYGDSTEQDLSQDPYYVFHVIMRRLCRRSEIPSSWGAHGFHVALGLNDENEIGVEFVVHGYKFEGSVRIVYQKVPDVFRVDIGHIGILQYTRGHLMFDEFIDVIDEYV